jgi:GNAT superfamily N-acetyltransferase
MAVPTRPLPILTSPTAPCARDLDALVLRRASLHDADAIVELYEQLSPESRHARFHGPKPHIDSATRAQLTSIDGTTVWLAFDSDRCVGEARVIPSASEACAELAVTVADCCQNHGLGFRLAQLAVEEHLQRGECVTFATMADNRRVARLAHTNHVALRFDAGLLHGLITGSRAATTCECTPTAVS